MNGAFELGSIVRNVSLSFILTSVGKNHIQMKNFYKAEEFLISYQTLLPDWDTSYIPSAGAKPGMNSLIHLNI